MGRDLIVRSMVAGLVGVPLPVSGEWEPSSRSTRCASGGVADLPLRPWPQPDAFGAEDAG